jgi:hypothetical protein
MSIDAGASDHATVAINVLSYLHAIASTDPGRPLANALRAALVASAETAAVPEMYREFMDAGPVTDPQPRAAASVTPLPVVVAATGNPELDQVTGAAHRWRGALAERDRAILAAFEVGILGQKIAEAAGMSVAGVYRLRQRDAGKFHRK